MNNQVTITEIEEMLETSRQYFKEKLLNGEFEVVEQGSHTIKLSVDGYIFQIWTGNMDIKESRKQYSYQCVGAVEPIDLKLTNEESTILTFKLIPIVKKYINDVEIKELEKRLSELKK